MWEDKSVPYIAVELISPGTESEDLGRTQRKPGEPPTKWEVYEQILGIPYYAVFDRYKDRFRAFQNTAGQYNEMILPGRRLWLPGLKIGLGLWHGTYRCVEYEWLRWYGADNNWIPTSDEEKQRAEKRAESEKKKAEKKVKAEKKKAEAEKKKAEAEKKKFEAEKKKAEAEKKKLQRRSVLALRKAGESDKSIAESLGISQNEVKSILE